MNIYNDSHLADPTAKEAIEKASEEEKDIRRVIRGVLRYLRRNGYFLKSYLEIEKEGESSTWILLRKRLKK